MSSLVSPLPDIGVVVEKSFDGIYEQAKLAGWKLPDHLSGAHSSRQLEWLASRLCLSEAFAKLGTFIDPSKLRFLNHQQLAGYPNYKFSFTHTRERAACWLVHDMQNKIRIGLDMEPTTRVISKLVDTRIDKRIKIVGSGSAQMSSLARWCLREAIFKAVPEHEQTRFLLLEIVVNLPMTFHLSGSALMGFYHLNEQPSFLTAFAWIP